MPWKECSAVSCREEFVVLARTVEANMSELCRRFGVSRGTGYNRLCVAMFGSHPSKRMIRACSASARCLRMVIHTVDVLRVRSMYGISKTRVAGDRRLDLFGKTTCLTNCGSANLLASSTPPCPNRRTWVTRLKEIC